MADKPGKPDWLEHAKQFKLLQTTKGMKIKEYAELHGLNVNSARRGINEVIKKLESGEIDHKGTGKGDQKAPARGRPKKDAKAAPGKETRKTGKAGQAGTHDRTSAPESDQNGVKSTPKNKNNSDHNSDQKNRVKTTERPTLTVVTGEVVSLPKSKRGAPKGSDNALSTGRKKRPRQQDIDAAAEDMKAFALHDNWQDTLESLLINDLLVQFELTKRARDKSLRRLLKEEMQEAIDEENPPPRIEGEVQVFNTPAEFKQLKMLTDTGYTLTDISRTVSAVMGRIAKESRDKATHQEKMQANAIKLRHAHEAHQLRMYGKMGGNVIGQAFQKMQEEDGSAIAAGQYLEERGIALPDTLRRLIDAEIEAERNKVDESTGVTNEEIDAYVAAKEAERAGHHEWLAAKRAETTALVDQFGYGDIDKDGVRRSNEIQAPLAPGEEFDESATADLYVEGAAQLTTEYDEEELTPEQEDESLWRGADNFHEDDEDDYEDDA